MLRLERFFSYHKNRKIAVILALCGTVIPIPGLQKFYLGQPLWGIVYILLSFVSISIAITACAIDAVWYLSQDLEQFDSQFNGEMFAYSNPINATASRLAFREIAESLRELDRLREEGLVTEYEFEQKRRQLLGKVS